MSVINGQAVSAEISNPSWVSKNTDDTTPSKLGLANVAAVSGTAIVNIQTEFNSLNSFTGSIINSLKNQLPIWVHNEVGTSTDNLKARIDDLTERFNGITGHTHDGTDGNGPVIASGGSVYTQATISNNVTSPANVTGLLFDFTMTRGFSTEYSLVRTNIVASNGTEDTAFYTNLGTAFNSSVEALAEDMLGKSYVAGNFTTFNGNSRTRLVRLNSDGTEDTAFATAIGTGFNGDVLTVHVQTNSQILVGGNFTTFNGNTRNNLVRLNIDGSEDTTFYTNMGAAFDSIVSKVRELSTGKILAGGFFLNFNGNGIPGLAQLNSNGTEDTAFDTNLGTGFNHEVNDTDEMSDGRLAIGGRLTLFNGNTRNSLVMLNANGSEDTAFYTNLGTAFNSTIHALQADSTKLVVGGSFSSFNGSTRNHLLRLNSSGTEDTTFYTNLGSALNNDVLSLDRQSDGSILLAGQFTTLNGNTRNRLARVDTTGTDDATFETNVGSGFNTDAICVLVRASGAIDFGGNFVTFNGNTRNRLIQLLGSQVELVTEGTLRGLYRTITSSWELDGSTSVGDSVGVTFSITNAGQVQYTSTDLGGATGDNFIRFIMFKL